jgi:hypothetical protein
MSLTFIDKVHRSSKPPPGKIRSATLWLRQQEVVLRDYEVARHRSRSQRDRTLPHSSSYLEELGIFRNFDLNRQIL